MDSNDVINTSGNWDTAFAPQEDLGLSPTINFVPKSATGEHNSPLGPLHGFDRASSGSMQAALSTMGSLTLSEHAFMQVSNPQDAVLFPDFTPALPFPSLFEYVFSSFRCIYSFFGYLPVHGTVHLICRLVSRRSLLSAGVVAHCNSNLRISNLSTQTTAGEAVVMTLATDHLMGRHPMAMVLTLGDPATARFRTEISNRIIGLVTDPMEVATTIVVGSIATEITTVEHPMG